ncbi:hypothetical protein V8F33_007947 [Rhypophila sp. PSN 637]
MWWRWRALNADDFRDEEDKFDHGWVYNGSQDGYYHRGEFASKENGDEYMRRTSIAGLLMLADFLFLGGVGSLAGAAGAAAAGLTAVGVVGAFVPTGMRESMLLGLLASVPLVSFSITRWLNLGPTHSYSSSERGSSGLAIRPTSCKTSPTPQKPAKHPDIQVGFDLQPPLTGTSRPAQLASVCVLIKAWLRDCDDHHECMGKPRSNETAFAPTRLIDVSSSSTIRLVESSQIDVSGRPDYITLSHRWGPSTTQARTTRANISSRYY